MAIRAKYTEQIVVLTTREVKARIKRLAEHMEESESEVIRSAMADDCGLDQMDERQGLKPITQKEIDHYAPERPAKS